MKIAYLVINELVTDGYLQTQVVSLLEQVATHGHQIDLINLVSPLNANKQAKKFAFLRARLKTAGVELLVLPYSIPYQLFIFNRVLLPIALVYYRWLLRRRLAGYDIVQCRSYFPALVVTLLKPESAKILFDPRSLFVKEHLAAGSFPEDSKIAKTWAKMEEKIVRNSSSTVCVSEPMAKAFADLVPNSRLEVISICANNAHFRGARIGRKDIRDQIGVGARPVFVFQGNLAINRFDGYAKTFARIWNLDPEAFFLILCKTRFHAKVNEILRENDIKSEDYFLRECSFTELPSWIGAGDFGLQTMAPAPDSETRLGIKFVEYLSCDLPVVTNRYCGAANAFVNEHGAGVTINYDDAITGAAGKLDQLYRLGGKRGYFRKLAEDHYSLAAVAKKYSNLYVSLCD